MWYQSLYVVSFASLSIKAYGIGKKTFEDFTNKKIRF